VDEAARRQAWDQLTEKLPLLRFDGLALTVLPDAIALATKIVQRQTTQRALELQPAAQLLLNYGDQAQFAVLTSALQRFQSEDESYYRELWGAAAYGQNPRELGHGVWLFRPVATG
jgi:hypothetical protein